MLGESSPRKRMGPLIEESVDSAMMPSLDSQPTTHPTHDDTLTRLEKAFARSHYVPRLIPDTLTDVKYLNATLSYLDTAFRDQHFLEPANEKFEALKSYVKTSLPPLYSMLDKWPNPPSLQGAVSFEDAFGDEIRRIQQTLIRSQLEFTVILSEARIPDQRNNFSTADANGVASRPVNEGEHPLAGEVGGGGAMEQKLKDSDGKGGREGTEHNELRDLLVSLPRTMRLSLLVQTLSQIEALATGPIYAGNQAFAAFGTDALRVLDLARDLDMLSRGENHFAKPVAGELLKSIDLSIKFLLYELSLLGKTIENNPRHFHESSLPANKFLQDHRILFMLLLTLVAGCRFSADLPIHKFNSEDGNGEKDAKSYANSDGNSEEEDSEDKDGRNDESSRDTNEVEDKDEDRDKLFEAALAAVMSTLAAHSGRVHEWWGRRCSVQNEMEFE